MSIEKTMQEEMNDEWFELAVKNVHKLVPDEWMPRINEILPKILNIVKIGIKKNIKNSADQLGNNKMFIMMNAPYILEDKSVMMVPSMYRIDKRQLGPSVLNESTGMYELRLKEGEQPEITFSMLTIATKINSYTNIQDLIKDFKDGTFITMADLGYTGDKDEQLNTAPDQKQIGTANG